MLPLLFCPKVRAFLLAFLLSSCARAPLSDPANVFLPAEAPPALRDSYPLDSLREALDRTILALTAGKNVPPEYRFAGRVVARDEYRRALEALRPELESLERFHAFVAANFDFHPVYGGDRPGEVFSTGYYDGTLKGSRRASARFSEPLYRTPKDMVSIDVSAFAARLPDVKPLQDLLLEARGKGISWRGRVVKDGAVTRVLPYWTRAEIQRERPLKGSEIAWVDPVDAFFLEIQGSGVVELDDGSTIRVGYDSQNGAPYTPIGKFLLDRIPKEQMSMQRIRAHLSTLTREQQQDLFDRNQSYVFFKEQKGEAVTFCGAGATAMRTIATDQALFPKGTLGWFEIEEPVFADGSVDPTGWEPKPRWVFDQDTGGAIRGGGRTDLFTGRGPEAERIAGVMKRKGRLWVLAPKPELLERLRAVIP